jgi:hypothetical protein
MLLQISDGTTTVVLSGTSPVRGCTYFPVTAQMQDGRWQDVAETAEVILDGTAANIRTSINAIERLLEQASERQGGILQPRVYVQYKPVDGDATSFRSEILEGRVVWSDNPGLRRLGETTPVVGVAVMWLRRPWWEGAETELQLASNASGTPATGGKAITNNAANWLQIAAAQVGGVLPSPVKVVIQNGTGGAAEYTRLYMATNAYSDPANFVATLAGSASSEGATWTVGLDATLAVAWDLDAATLQDTQGRWFRVVASWNDLVGPCTIQLQLKDSTGAYTLWSGETIVVTAIYTALLDLGSVPLPPGGYAASYGALQLVLNCRGPMIADLEFLQLMATDSFRYVELYGTPVGSNDYVVDDGIEGVAYVLDGSTYLPGASPRGLPLMIFPNRLQRVHILHQVDLSTPSNAPTNASTVQVYYRPRRLTV